MNCQWKHPFNPCYLTSVFGSFEPVASWPLQPPPGSVQDPDLWHIRLNQQDVREWSRSARAARLERDRSGPCRTTLPLWPCTGSRVLSFGADKC